MEHTWAKIKSWIQTYLSSWKTTNFGNGTYNNAGNIKVDSESSLMIENAGSGFHGRVKVNNDEIAIESFLGDNIKKSFRIQNGDIVDMSPSYGNVNDAKVVIGKVSSSGSVTIIPTGNSGKIKYFIIGQNGIKKGTTASNSDTPETVNSVGDGGSSYIFVGQSSY